MHEQGPSLTIELNATTSDAIDFESRGDLGNAEFLMIGGPASLTGTVVVEISIDGTNFITLTAGGVNVVVTAGKATPIDFVCFAKLRVKSSASELAEREFTFRYGKRAA